MRLLLIRHGQTESNVRGVLDTAIPGPPLTQLGRRQAEALVDALGTEPIEAVYASNLLRTRQTAEPLAAARGVNIRIRDGVREISAGELEMAGDEASVRQYLGAIFDWTGGNLDTRIPGGPSGRQVLGEYDGAIAGVAHHSMAAVFSHGAVIRTWVGLRADNIAADYTLTHGLDNTGIAVLDGSPEAGWTLLSWEGAAVGPEPIDKHDAGPAAESITESEARRGGN